ncbi:MAG: hypothetical protein JWO31_894 [Phycisphaerales bacterium]|nr:hypothetical protein [Phycisphaerales bacterium]
MPDEINKARTAVTTATTARPTTMKQVAAGEVVHVVGVGGVTYPGNVIVQHEDGRADVAFEQHGKPVTITGSPHDPTGKLPDSHHRP